MSFMIKIRSVLFVPTTLKVRAMFKLLEMIDLCILLHTSLLLVPNNWLRDTPIELMSMSDILTALLFLLVPLRQARLIVGWQIIIIIIIIIVIVIILTIIATIINKKLKRY